MQPHNKLKHAHFDLFKRGGGSVQGWSGAILEKRSVNVLTIKVSGMFPPLVGALGAVAEEVVVKSYDCLMIRMGDLYLQLRKVPVLGGLSSPFW